MLQNFRYTLLSAVRNPALLFWPLAFPIVMSLIFSLMFANLGDSYELHPVALAVVDDANYDAALGLDDTLLAFDGDPADEQHYVDISRYDDAEGAQEAVTEGVADAYLTVDDDGMPRLHVMQANMNESSRLYLTAVTAILDGYTRTWHEMRTVAKRDPSLLIGEDALAQIRTIMESGDQDTIGPRELAGLSLSDGLLAQGVRDAFLGEAVGTSRLRLTRADPDPSARYYYALLGMAAGLGAGIAFQMVHDLQARGSALGARRSVSGTPRWRLLVSAAAAAWLLAFACLAVGFVFMWKVVGVDFGGRMDACVLALAVASLAFCAMGALLGTFPHLPPTIVTAFVTPLCFFAGLYGTSSQRVADNVARAVPWLAALNPVRQTAQLFYSLLYYDTLERFGRIALTLVAMAAVFSACAAARMRRQRYAQL